MPSESLATGRDEPVLVIRFSSLGDILLTAPALRRLRERFPDSPLHLLVASEYADAARLIPGPDRVLTFDRSEGFAGLWRLRGELARRYSVLVDLQNSARSAFLRAAVMPVIWTKAKRYRMRRWLLIRFKKNFYGDVKAVPERYLAAMTRLGATDDGRGLELAVPEAAREWAGAYLPTLGLGADRFVVLCPGARHATKRWPAERWQELGRGLRGDGLSVLVVGGASEAALVTEIAGAIPGAVALADRSLVEVAAVFLRAAAVVSNDSGLMHLAAGVGTPLVAVFGPTVEEFGFYPFRARAEVLEHSLYCRPCTAIGGERCPQGHFRCMLDTSSQMTLAAVRRLLAQSPVEPR